MLTLEELSLEENSFLEPELSRWMDTIYMELGDLRKIVEQDFSDTLDATKDKMQTCFEEQTKEKMKDWDNEMFNDYKQYKDRLRQEVKACKDMQLNMYRDMDDFTYFHNQALEIRRSQILEDLDHRVQQAQRTVKEQEKRMHDLHNEVLVMYTDTKSIQQELIRMVVQWRRKVGGLV
jgi:hypothetical protein